MADFQNQPPSYQVPTQIQFVHQAQQVHTEVHSVPATAIPAHPAVRPVIQDEGWWRRNHKNKPQSNSAGAAALIFVSGGMSMAWNLGFLINFKPYFLLTQHLICSWFIGCIIGAVVGAVACNFMSKKLLVSFASVLVTVCGILQVSDADSYEAILASRYLNGIAVGLVFPLTFVLLGEEMVKSLRGMNAATVDTMSFGCGIFIQILYSSLWTNDLEDKYQAMQMSGILNIIYGVVALLIARFCIVESPLYYLMHGDEQMAIDSLRRLQRPFTVTYETYELLEEHKQYLARSNQRSLQQNIEYGIPALLKLCFYRAFMALTFSLYTNSIFSIASWFTTRDETYPYILYGLARWLGPILVVFTLDSRGRKPPMIIGFFVCTILAFAVGGILDNQLYFLQSSYMNAVKYILIFFQLFASIAMVSSSVYLSEAFPLPVKSYFMAIVFIAEMLVHIIIICSKESNLYAYFIALGSLSLVFLGVAIFSMPETKCYPLRDCLAKFRHLNNFRN